MSPVSFFLLQIREALKKFHKVMDTARNKLSSAGQNVEKSKLFSLT